MCECAYCCPRCFPGVVWRRSLGCVSTDLRSAGASINGVALDGDEVRELVRGLREGLAVTVGR